MRLVRGDKGFTLIEILIVFSLIGVLAAIGLSSYIQAQKRGRDAKRFSDLEAIAVAQEQYFGENGEYVDTTDGPCSGVFPSSIMDTVPKDPLNNSTYVYTCEHPNANREAAFCVSVKLEAGKGNCAACVCPDTGNDCTLSAGTDYYCVKNRQ